MHTINYEVEYDNRGRIPEHPQIFARWDREAADYRATARGAEFGIKYGPSPRQTYDLFPAANDGPSTPLALFIHGGWWRSLEPAKFSQMAKGPNAHGVTVAVAGYDLCPAVSIATIIDEMKACCLALWRRYKKRIFVYGHSAGGHLAACMLAQEWTKLASDAPDDLVPAAYAVSGVFDLDPLLHVSQNADLKLTPAEARKVSPVHWSIPSARRLDAVVGALESNEFLRQSRYITEAWDACGASVRFEEIPHANHFTVIDPLSDAKSRMTARVVQLARDTAGLD
jgi:arylformamidase